MNTQQSTSPWMQGFKIGSDFREPPNPTNESQESTDKRHAIEDHQERMAHKKQLKEWGLA